MRTRRARGPRGLTVLNDYGVRRLAAAVLQQAIGDLDCTSEPIDEALKPSSGEKILITGVSWRD